MSITKVKHYIHHLFNLFAYCFLPQAEQPNWSCYRIQIWSSMLVLWIDSSQSFSRAFDITKWDALFDKSLRAWKRLQRKATGGAVFFFLARQRETQIVQQWSCYASIQIWMIIPKSGDMWLNLVETRHRQRPAVFCVEPEASENGWILICPRSILICYCTLSNTYLHVIQQLSGGGKKVKQARLKWQITHCVASPTLYGGR